MLPESRYATIWLSKKAAFLSIVFLSILIITSVFAVWGYKNPQFDQEMHRTIDFESSTTVSTSAKSVMNNTMYNKDEKVSDVSYYVLENFPSVNVTMRTEVNEGTSGQETVHHNASIMYVAQRDNTEFWESKNSIEKRETFKSNSDKFSINMQTVLDEKANVTETLRNRGTVKPYLVVKVSSGEFSKEKRLPIEINQVLYRIDTSDADELNIQSVQTDTTSTKSYPLYMYGSAGIAVLSLFGLILSLYLFRHGVSEEDDWYYSLKLLEQSNWVTRARCDIETKNKSFVRVENPREMRDIAYDTDSRIIYDSEEKALIVSVEDTVYYAISPEGDELFFRLLND